MRKVKTEQKRRKIEEKRGDRERIELKSKGNCLKGLVRVLFLSLIPTKLFTVSYSRKLIFIPIDLKT